MIAIGSGETTRRTDEQRFASCEGFTFDGDLVVRLESYRIPLP